MQSQVRLVASALGSRGVAVSVAVGGDDGEGALNGVETVSLPRFSRRSPVRFISALRRTVAEGRFDVVHGHGLRLAPALAVSGARRRYVTCHGLDPTRARATLMATKLSRVPVVACGEGPRAVMAAHGVNSIVINNALASLEASPSPGDPRSELGLASDVPLVVLPARFSHQKGHDLLVAALARVRAAMADESPEVVCVGDGPLLEATRRAAAVAGDRPLLHCVPYREGVAGWLAAADFFVLPSRWEGQPQVVLEALLNNLPVLTSTPTGVEDLVIDGRNGRRVLGPGELAREIETWSRRVRAGHRDELPHDATLNAEILAAHRLEVVLDQYLALYATG